MNITQGSLVVIDGKTVLWNGHKLNVQSFSMHYNTEHGPSCRIELCPTDTAFAEEMKAAGLKVRIAK